MKRRNAASPVFTLLLASTACSGGGGPGNGSGSSGGISTPPPAVSASYSFPAGDATSAAGAMAWDIVGVKTTLTGTPGSPAGNSYDTLRVDVAFAQDVRQALPAPGSALSLGTQLGVGIALDVDGNFRTGEYGTCNTGSPLRPFEYFSDPGTQPGRLLDGNYGIIDPNGNLVSSGSSNPPGEAVTSVSGHVVSQVYYLPAVDVFAGSAIPNIGVAVSAHNGAELSPTDCVPRWPTIEVFTK